MGYRTISTNVRRYHTQHTWHFFFQEDSALVPMHCACNTVQLLRLSRLPFSWTKPQQPELNALTTRFRELYSSVSMSRESKRLKKSRSDWLNYFWQCADTAYLSEKMRFSCFPVLPGSAKAQVIWGGIVKCLLIAYFIDNISVRNIKMLSHVPKL